MLMQTWGHLRTKHNHLYLHDTLNPFNTSVVKSAVCSCSYFHPSSCMFILWNDASLCNQKCPFLFLKKVVDAAKRAEVGLQKLRCWLFGLLDSLLLRQQQTLMNKPIYTLSSCMHAYVWVSFTMLIRSVALWHHLTPFARLMHCGAVHRYCDFFWGGGV